jgi:hypothetical protein
VRAKRLVTQLANLTAYTYREFLLQCGCQHSAR